MFNKKEKINETYECREKQWYYWENSFFGGLPLVDIILSHPPLLSVTNEYPPRKIWEQDEELDEIECFDFTSEIKEGNILFAYITYDWNIFELINDTKLFLDGRLQKNPPCCDTIEPVQSTQRYFITEENVANYLESLPIKEELMNMYIFRDLVSLICDYLNRDKRRMAEAQEHIRRGVISSSKKVDSIFQEFFDDRNSTTAKIKAICSNGIISPDSEKDSLAGQESTLEKKIENQPIIIPEKIRKKFDYFIKKGWIKETEEGFYTIIKMHWGARDLYKRVLDRKKQKENCPTRKELAEYVRKPDGNKYSLDVWRYDVVD